MKRKSALCLLAVCCLSASTAFGQSLALGTAEGRFGETVTLPLSLSSSPLGEPIQAAQAIFDWDADAGTGVDLAIDPAIGADADFLSFHVADDWMALGFTIVTAPLTGDDLRLAGVVIECAPGPAARETPVTFRDRVYSVPGSSLVLSNTVTIDSSSVRRENGLELIDGSLRCFGAEICGDGVDGDGDGLVDAEDPDCPADIDVTPLALDYGSVFVGTESSLDVTIRNTGSKELTLTGLQIASNPDFTLAGAPVLPAMLAPGGELSIAVTYRPQADELDSGTLRIRSTDADEPELSVALAGSGLPTLSEGLGAHLPLDCSAEDAVSGESGTAVGFVGCAADRFGGDDSALAFDGSGWIDGASFPVVVGDFILEAWFRPDAAAPGTTGTVFAVHHDDPSRVPPLNLEWDGQSHLLLLRRGDSPKAVEGLAADWHHVLIARRGGSLSLYVDAQLASVSTDSEPLGGSYTLGADRNGSRLYHGRLDELTLEVSAFDGGAEAIARALRGGPSVYAHPSDRVRGVTAPPGFTARALDLRLTTASSESGDLELRSLSLIAEDITGAGGASPSMDYLTNGRLILETECGGGGSAVTAGEFVVSLTGVRSSTYTLASTQPVVVPVASDTCLAVLFDLDTDAPLDRAIQFRVDTLDDIDLRDEQGERRYIAGQRLAGRAALEGDRLRILDALPPELELVYPAEPETINAADALADAPVHSLELTAGASEGLRVLDIAYEAVEGTSLDGLANPRLFVDLNGNKALDAGEVARTGTLNTDAGRVVFTGLGIEIPASSAIELVLLADLEIRETAVAAGVFTIPAMLAIALLLLLVRHQRLQPRLLTVLAMMLVCCVIGIGGGCSGGGGGGGSAAPATTEQRFQLRIGTADDIRVEGMTTGTEPDLTLPAGGIPGPLFVLKG